MGVPADHPAWDWLGEGDGLADRSRPAGADLPHGALLQHVRAPQRTLRGNRLVFSLCAWSASCREMLTAISPAGVLLVSPVLRVGLDPADHSLCKLLEVVRGSRSGVHAGEDRGDRRVPYGRPLHRGGQPAAFQGAEHKASPEP